VLIDKQRRRAPPEGSDCTVARQTGEYDEDAIPGDRSRPCDLLVAGAFSLYADSARQRTRNPRLGDDGSRSHLTHGPRCVRSYGAGGLESRRSGDPSRREPAESGFPWSRRFTCPRRVVGSGERLGRILTTQCPRMTASRAAKGRDKAGGWPRNGLGSPGVENAAAYAVAGTADAWMRRNRCSKYMR
jgi:hypothetical protein